MTERRSQERVEARKGAPAPHKRQLVTVAERWLQLFANRARPYAVQQADGSELAKQVIIFPKELRGAAEGSVLLDAPGATTHNRMTNGSVSKPAVSRSRMTNGTVQKGASSTLVVQYQDGSQTISIPAGVQVVLVAKEAVTLSAGDTIYAATEKLPDGMLTTNKILQIVAASRSNAQ